MWQRFKYREIFLKILWFFRFFSRFFWLLGFLRIFLRLWGFFLRFLRFFFRCLKSPWKRFICPSRITEKQTQEEMKEMSHSNKKPSRVQTSLTLFLQTLEKRNFRGINFCEWWKVWLRILIFTLILTFFCVCFLTFFASDFKKLIISEDSLLLFFFYRMQYIYWKNTALSDRRAEKRYKRG